MTQPGVTENNPKSKRRPLWGVGGVIDREITASSGLKMGNGKTAWGVC